MTIIMKLRMNLKIYTLATVINETEPTYPMVSLIYFYLKTNKLKNESNKTWIVREMHARVVSR